MLTSYPCPVCQEDNWREVQTFRYRASDYTVEGRDGGRRTTRKLRRILDLLVHDSPFPREVAFDMRRTLTHYQRVRWQILFEKWLPGSQEIRLTSRYCADCGFVAYVPRPSEEDLRAKHLFLGQFSPMTTPTQLSRHLDRKRADRIYDAVVPWIDDRELVVLDYGGGDGKLMLPFREQGHRCLLIDYQDRPLAGIERIAADLDELEPSLKVDVIICSHVLEHLSDPLGVIQKLCRHLVTDGVLYSEVPDQVWAGIRIEEDPVTHVNFFTARSFSAMHEHAGYGVLMRRCQPGSYGSTHTRVIVVVARRSGDAAPAGPTHTGADTLAYLHPGRLRSLLWLLRYHLLARMWNRWLDLWLRLRPAARAKESAAPSSS